ncbi:MAG: FAD-dependent oxidoreductase [Mesorhizobium sp.]|nr:MAG: FAD-dependent oxidoreductase [Mesorhizobium sp.]
MTENLHFPRLFSSLRLRDLEIRNRIVSTSHGTYLLDRSLLTEATAAYYAALARGGVGLIILEAASAHASAVYNDSFLTCHSDEVIPGFRRVAEEIHANGAKVFGQLYHPGASMRGRVEGRRLVPVGPSQGAHERTRIPARAMSLSLIQEVIAAFGEAASRMMTAGLDGIEINARNGNLPAQFVSTAINRRTDLYGGAFANRLRFLAEIVHEVRRRIGDSVPLGLRVSIEPMDEVGPSSKEIQEACKALGPFVDYFNVVTGSLDTYAGFSHIVPPMGVSSEAVVSGAEILRAATGRPVLVAGRITRPEVAERLLADGQIDLCGMTRALIADPELPNKAKSGQAERIRDCIGCNQACIGHEGLGAPVSCIQHPETGRELALGPRSGTRHPRRILVAGGGPAGLKAAAVAAERGHHVTLFEREQHFGGQARLAALIPGRGEFGGMVPNLVREAQEAGARLVAGTLVDLNLVKREGAEAVIIATGSLPLRSTIDHDEIAVWDASQILGGEAGVSGSVVIADERCDWVGMGVAEKLVREGHPVRLCVSGDMAGQELDSFTRFHWLGILHRLGVEIVTHVRLATIVGRAVSFEHVASLTPISWQDVEALVLARSHQSNTKLEEILADFDGDVHVIGDCHTPRTAEEGVYEGLMAGLAV